MWKGSSTSRGFLNLVTVNLVEGFVYANSMLSSPLVNIWNSYWKMMGKFLNSSERWLSSVLHEYKEIWRSRFGSRFHIAMTNFLNKLFKCYFLNLLRSCDYQSLAWSPLLHLIMFQSKQGNQEEEEIFQMLAAGSVYQEH